MAKLRFLLLEDSSLDVELIHAHLGESGVMCELSQVTTRREFEAALEQGCFDIILADYSLPGFDGFTALEIARCNCPDIPFIFVTATLGEEVAIETLKNGATDYVLKQRLERLGHSVQRALREAQERRERKQVQAELYRREQEFRALVENSPDIISRIDKNLRHLYVCPAVEAATGIPPSKFIGKTHPEIGFPEEVYVPWQAALQQVFTTGVPAIFEFDYQAIDGMRCYSTQIVPEFAQDGSIGSLLSISRDITEYKQMFQAVQASEAQLRQQAEQLTQANQIKDEFLAVLSHELRSPLNAILGWAKLLRDRNFDSATMSRALEIIERNARLQTQLIEDLLDISRIIRGQLTLHPLPTNLASVINTALDSLRLAAEAKSIDLQFNILDSADIGDKFLVSGDASRLQQIVWNLVSNAIKFTSNGGQVEITLSHQQDTNQITVTDSGKGISSDFLPFVFESFRQADGSSTRNYGGLGLGLAIVRNLVELHGGTVTAASPGEGKGATFIVSIPALKAAESSEIAAPTAGDTSSPLAPLAGIRVLVVDDEPDSQEFVAFVLQEYGAIVGTAASAASALEMLPSFQPDLLLSDIGMPDEDGYSLIRKVRSLTQLPAVALTAYARSDDRVHAIEAGFQTHLSKPVEPTELVSVVANLVKCSQKQLTIKH